MVETGRISSKHKQPIYKLHRVVASSDTFRVAFVLNDGWFLISEWKQKHALQMKNKDT